MTISNTANKPSTKHENFRVLITITEGSGSGWESEANKF